MPVLLTDFLPSDTNGRNILNTGDNEPMKIEPSCKNVLRVIIL